MFMYDTYYPETENYPETVPSQKKFAMRNFDQQQTESKKTVHF